MADISLEIAMLQMATTGEEIRSATIAALEAINSDIYPYYSGAYTFTPSTASQTISVSGYALTSNIIIEAYALASKVITSNGTYYASSDSVNGFYQVEVVIPSYTGAYTITPDTTSQTLSTSGKFMAQDLVVEAYALASKVITSNGTYYASSDSVNGYSQVEVAIPVASKMISDNGVYYASSDSVFGYSIVTVSIPVYSGSYY